MKNTIFIFFILLGLTSCLKDEDLIQKEETVESAIVINEVYSTGDPDWVEIYNQTDEDVNMKGYKISDGYEPKYTIEGDQIVPANGFLVLPIDKEIMGFSLSSNGESFSIWNSSDELLDQIDFPALETGISYGRETDGADNWIKMVPSPGKPNSNVNNPPEITADTIKEMNDNVGYFYKINVVDASGIESVKILYKTATTAKYEEMAPLGDGEYAYQFPVFKAGDEVEYYVVATDRTGLMTYFPNSAPDEGIKVSVVDGAPVFEQPNITVAETAPGVNSLTFTVSAYDVSGVDEVKVYYLINETDEANKAKEVMTDNGDGTYTYTITGLSENDVVAYYFRAEDVNGNKAYFPTEDENFDHDLGTTWPTYTIGQAPPVNGFSQLTITGGTASEDLVFNVHVAYDNGDVQEVKFYYYINFDQAAYDADPTGYEDANRVSIKWSGDLPTTDDMYQFTIPNTDLNSGDKVIWYMRAKDGNGDKKYFTYGQGEDFDKDVISDWHEITIQ